MLEGSEPSEKPESGKDSGTGVTNWGTQGSGAPGIEDQLGIPPFSEILRLDSPEATSSLDSSCGC